MIRPVIEELVRQDINLVQMPCPESQLGGYDNGLRRDPKGIDTYDTPVFGELCSRLASETVDLIKAILSNGYQILAILGIEYSPSCAINYQYTSRGTANRRGIFIEALDERLKKENIEIPFIGINRRAVEKSLNEIRGLFNENKQARLDSYKIRRQG